MNLLVGIPNLTEQEHLMKMVQQLKIFLVIQLSMLNGKQKITQSVLMQMVEKEHLTQLLQHMEQKLLYQQIHLQENTTHLMVGV